MTCKHRYLGEQYVTVACLVTTRWQDGKKSLVFIYKQKRSMILRSLWPKRALARRCTFQSTDSAAARVHSQSTPKIYLGGVSTLRPDLRFQNVWATFGRPFKIGRLNKVTKVALMQFLGHFLLNISGHTYRLHVQPAKVRTLEERW